MFHIESRGQGRPVLFIHGFLESSSMWKDFIDLEFDSKIQSLLIDLPGHGKSPLVGRFNSLREIATAIKNHLAQREIVDFDVVGHSLGGYVAIELHKLLPLNSKLVLFHSNFWEDEAERKVNRNRTIEAVLQNKNLFIKQAIPNLFSPEFREKDFVKDLIKEALKIDMSAIVLYSELMRDRPSNEMYVKEIKSNFLFIQGRNDQIIPIGTAKQFLGEKNMVITNAGHMGHFESKQEERKIIFNYFTDFSNQM